MNDMNKTFSRRNLNTKGWSVVLKKQPVKHARDCEDDETASSVSSARSNFTIYLQGPKQYIYYAADGKRCAQNYYVERKVMLRNTIDNIRAPDIISPNKCPLSMTVVYASKRRSGTLS